MQGPFSCRRGRGQYPGHRLADPTSSAGARAFLMFLRNAARQSPWTGEGGGRSQGLWLSLRSLGVLRKSRSAAELCEEVVSTYIQNWQLFVYLGASRYTYRIGNCLSTLEPLWGPIQLVCSPPPPPGNCLSTWESLWGQIWLVCSPPPPPPPPPTAAEPANKATYRNSPDYNARRRGLIWAFSARIWHIYHMPRPHNIHGNPGYVGVFFISTFSERLRNNKHYCCQGRRQS